MKSLPITYKANRSPLKMSGSELVANDAQTHKKFVDAKGAFDKGRKEALDDSREDEIHKAKLKEPKEKAKVPAMADTSGIDTKEAVKGITAMAGGVPPVL
jgi:hypothetical protein